MTPKQGSTLGKIAMPPASASCSKEPSTRAAPSPVAEATQTPVTPPAPAQTAQERAQRSGPSMAASTEKENKAEQRARHLEIKVSVSVLSSAPS